MSASPKKNVAAPKLRFSDFTEAWQKTRLVDVADIKRGAGSQYLTYVQTEHEGIRLIRIGDFLGSDPVFVEDTKDMKRFRLQRDDILIAGTGATAGITFKVPEKFIDFAFSYNAPRIRVREADSDFVVSYLKSGIILRQQHRLFTGNAQPFLDTAAIGGFKMRVPTLPEQRKIADFLTAVDGRIQQLSQKRALLQDYKKGVMQQIFSQALRFKDDHGNEFPDWQQKTLGEVCEIVNGLTYSPEDVVTDGLLVLRSSNVQDGKIVFGDNVYVKAKVNDWNMSRPDDILICVRNGSKSLIGKNAIIPEGGPQSTHGAFMTVLRGKQNRFVFQLLQTDVYKRNVHINLGATINSINGSDLKRFKFWFPSVSEQTKIANFLTALDRKIESVAHQIAHTQSFKKGLLQQMFV